MDNIAVAAGVSPNQFGALLLSASSQYPVRYGTLGPSTHTRTNTHKHIHIHTHTHTSVLAPPLPPPELILRGVRLAGVARLAKMSPDRFDALCHSCYVLARMGDWSEEKGRGGLFFDRRCGRLER